MLHIENRGFRPYVRKRRSTRYKRAPKPLLSTSEALEVSRARLRHSEITLPELVQVQLIRRKRFGRPTRFTASAPGHEWLFPFWTAQDVLISYAVEDGGNFLLHVRSDWMSQLHEETML